MGGDVILYQADIFDYIPIKILEKPSLLNPFRDWKLEVNGKIITLPWYNSKEDIIRILENRGELQKNHFAIFNLHGFRVLSSEKEGTYLYSPYSGQTYYIASDFVKMKTEVANLILNHLDRILDPSERDRIELCAKKILKHPTEIQLVYAY
jgi:hypothetical protein